MIYLRVHKKKTCYELMHGRTPKVSHFHIFGFKCFILKKGKKLEKFEAGSVDGIVDAKFAPRVEHTASRTR
jgi:hypothetical protein